MKRPMTPTKEEPERHLPLHLEYRDWCEDCVAGRGVAAPHRSRTDDEGSIGVTIHGDYSFLRREEREEGLCPILILFDENHGAFWAMGMRSKAVNHPIVKWAVEKLNDSGYNGARITFKTDQEDTIVALKTAVAATRTGITTPIESPVRASKSNGRMERGVRTYTGHLRTIKVFTERTMGLEIPA